MPGDRGSARSVCSRVSPACRDRGVNFFDCADVYVKGRSEEILGRLIKGERDNLFFAAMKRLLDREMPGYAD